VNRGVLTVLAAGAMLSFLPATVLGADSDGDGLPNKWEAKKAPGGLKLKKLGAKPKHKDVFVELDFSQDADRANVTCGDYDQLYQAFKDAPVSNPDGKDGVALHIDAGRNCPSRKYDLGGSNGFEPAGACANPSDIASALANKRLKVFHLGGVVTNDELCGAEGIASGADFIVKEQGGGGFPHVTMHELGHIFGLDHGPINSWSVMSGVISEYDTQEVLIDYARYPIEALDEQSLSEPNGYESTPAGEEFLGNVYSRYHCEDPPGTFNLTQQEAASANIDFDCDGYPFYVPPESQYIDAEPVSADVDGDGDLNGVPASEPEWPLLDYAADRIGG
jgi:hypothetical protein